MERFGKQSRPEDEIESVKTKVMNSGIKSDSRIYSSLSVKAFEKLIETEKGGTTRSSQEMMVDREINDNELLRDDMNSERNF